MKETQGKRKEINVLTDQLDSDDKVLLWKFFLKVKMSMVTEI